MACVQSILLLSGCIEVCMSRSSLIASSARLPHSLEKVVPILVLQFENYPFFAAKNRLLSSKRPLFRNKTLTFQSKMNPLFCGKTLPFQTKWTSFFMVKHWTSKLTSFSPNSRRWVAKYPLYLGKCKCWISSKIPLYSRILELGCVR